MSGEQVYVVPRSAVIDEAGWHGIRTEDLDAFVASLERVGGREKRTARAI